MEKSSLKQTERDILHVCNGIATMLIEKNRVYGDSALSPQRIFSRSNTIEQLKVRIDDKLSRLANMVGDDDVMGEDVVRDLQGYLVLLQIARMRKAEEAKANNGGEDLSRAKREMDKLGGDNAAVPNMDTITARPGLPHKLSVA